MEPGRMPLKPLGEREEIPGGDPVKRLIDTLAERPNQRTRQYRSPGARAGRNTHETYLSGSVQDL
jgi:hypothetical protein